MEKKKKEKKGTILQAAQEAFHSAGYTGTSIDTIAEKAKVTKQTVYRYFESKELLFKAVMEAQRSQQSNMEFVETLEQENTKEALENFALGFIQWHLSKEHLANIRLLISEGPMIPEITRWFYARGPQSTEALLAGFLRNRLHIEDEEYIAKVFTNTLLAFRQPVLIGLEPPPSESEMRRHAEKTVQVILKLSKKNRG